MKSIVAGPIDRDIRRIHSAYHPAVLDVATDDPLGRDIVDAQARELAVQKRSLRRQARRQPAPADDNAA